MLSHFGNLAVISGIILTDKPHIFASIYIILYIRHLQKIIFRYEFFIELNIDRNERKKDTVVGEGHT
jgi:hypothetical protein